jgi:hypothetical protein
MTAKNAMKYEITKEELNDLYAVKGMSSNEIAKHYGMKSHKTVTAYLKQYGIPIRNKSQALMAHHNGIEPQKPLTDLEKEIIVGELLGDGNLTIDHRNTNNVAIPFYRHSSKFKEYLEWLSKIMPSLRWCEITETDHHMTKKSGEQQISFRLRSQCHPELFEIYNMFYRFNENNEQYKIVPTDLKLTPTMLRHWFIGDGSAGEYSCGRRNGIQRKAWQMYLATFCFSEKEVEYLINQLGLLGIKAEKNRKQAGLCIRIAAESFDTFYQTIGKCPVPCYQYKWRTSNV